MKKVRSCTLFLQDEIRNDFCCRIYSGVKVSKNFPDLILNNVWIKTTTGGKIFLAEKVVNNIAILHGNKPYIN